MQGTHIYLASTPLNIILACSIAVSKAKKNQAAILLLIDQPAMPLDNVYLKALQDWPQNPFSKVLVLSIKQRKLIDKVTQRKKAFKLLKALIAHYQPTQIYTGNDRRIEFQYAFHVAKNYCPQPIGVYYEDGLFSYLPRQPSALESWLGKTVNRLCYGRWRELPPSAGHSSQVTKVFAAFPELVCDALQSKQLYPLPRNLADPAMMNLAGILLSQQGESVTKTQLTHCQQVFILPHESNYGDINQYKKMLKAQFKPDAANILIKYHPRNRQSDALNLAKEPNIALLNPLIPFEFYLPYLTQAQVIGDISAALLTTRWLNPDLSVQSFAPPQDIKRAELYQELGIEFLV